MNDLVGMHVMACTDELHHEKPRFRLCEAATTAKHVHEGTTLTELEGHVNVFVILEAVTKRDDVWVLQGTVNFDLCVQLHNVSAAKKIGNKRDDTLWSSPSSSLSYSLSQLYKHIVRPGCLELHKRVQSHPA